MKWRRLRIIFCGVLLVVAITMPLLTPLTAHAQSTPTQGLSLTTSPLPIIISAKPGQTVKADIRIKNSGTTAENLRVQLMKFYSNDGSGRPTLAERGPADSYFDWVSFSRPVIKAEPNVWETVTVTIAIPPSAGLGYYYAVVFQRTGTPEKPLQGTAVAGGAATLMLLDVKSPNAKRSLELVSLKTSKRVYEFLPSSFDVTIKNNGNIFLSPSGSIFIRKGGKQVALLDLNANHGNLLPNSNRVFTVKWDEGFPVYTQKIENGQAVTDAKGKPATKLDWSLQNASKFRFGKFTAQALVIYDNGQEDIPIEATVSFWVIPWRIIGAIVLVLALFIFLIVRYIQFIRYKNRTKSKPSDREKPKESSNKTEKSGEE